MMKKLGILSLAALSCGLYAMQPNQAFTMPDAATLHQRLYEADFGYFAEKTNIIEKLAGKQKTAVTVNLTVELAMYDFAKYLNNSMIYQLTREQKPELLEALLQDQPQAIEELKQQGMFK